MVLGMAIQMNGHAQPSALEPETLKVESAHVVVADSLSKSLLFQNAMKYVVSLKNNEERFELKLKDSIDGKLYGQSTFFVYTQQAGILKKISGTITYQLSIEVKDSKYRYQFNDFVFHYYKQDRYYNMVATGKTKPLEDISASGWQKLWNSHRTTCQTKLMANGDLLQKTMKEKPESAKKPKEVKIEW